MIYIDMLAWFDKEGNPNPIRFRTQNKEGENIVLRVEKVTNKETRKVGGNYIIYFHSKVVSDDRCMRMKLMYELGSCKWGFDRDDVSNDTGAVSV
jgi:hypothetical protein